MQKPTLNQAGVHLIWNQRLLSYTDRSAHSGKRITSGGIRLPVPGAPGLAIVLLPLEARQLSPARKEELFAAARQWRDAFEAATDPVRTVPDDTTAPPTHKSVQPDFEAMKVADLKAYADDHSIDLGDASRKEDIITVLRGEGPSSEPPDGAETGDAESVDPESVDPGS